jgi:hypothetical protein
LFGINGWAGILRINQIEHVGQACHAHTYPGLKLDDFTQGVIHGAVFAIEAPAGLKFKVNFELGVRGGELSDGDLELLRLLIDDAKELGWTIGHSTGIGFGWFDVKLAKCGDAFNSYEKQEAAE